MVDWKQPKSQQKIHIYLIHKKVLTKHYIFTLLGHSLGIQENVEGDETW